MPGPVCLGLDRVVLRAAHPIASTWNPQALPFLSHGAISVTFPPVIPVTPRACTLRFGAKTRKRSRIHDGILFALQTRNRSLLGFH